MVPKMAGQARIYFLENSDEMTAEMTKILLDALHNIRTTTFINRLLSCSKVSVSHGRLKTRSLWLCPLSPEACQESTVKMVSETSPDIFAE